MSLAGGNEISPTGGTSDERDNTEAEVGNVEDVASHGPSKENEVGPDREKRTATENPIDRAPEAYKRGENGKKPALLNKMETEWHRSFNGKASLGHVMEQRMIETLEKTLPSTVTIHMDPSKSSSSYVFQTLGRKDETERSRNTYRNQYTNSRLLSPITKGKREYYLEFFECLEDEHGHTPEGNITVPHVKIPIDDMINIAEDENVAENWGWWGYNE